MKIGALVKESATLAGGNMLSQLIAVASYFLLTRIYTPDDYGLFNIFYSYIEVLLIASTCKYELSVVVADSEREAAAITRFALRLNTIVSLTLLGMATVLWCTGALPSNLAQLGWLVMLIPPLVFFSGTSRIYSFLYNRFHRYKQIALSDNANAASGALFKIVLGLLGASNSGLPTGTVLGQAIANINYRIGLRRLDLPLTTTAEQRAAARKHRNFPLFVASKDLINSISANLPFLWAAIYFDRAEVGLFGLALTFTLQPVNLLSSAFERVLYARAAEAVRERRPIGSLIGRFILAVNAVAIPVCIVAWFVAEPVFVFCFGSRWHGCGPYVQALLPWALMAFNSTTLMFVANVFGTQRTELFFYCAMILLRVAAIYAGIRMGSFLLAIRMYAVASALVHAALIVWYVAQVRRYGRGLRA